MSDNEGANGAEPPVVEDEQGQNQDEELKKMVEIQAKDLAGKDRKLSEIQKRLAEFEEKENKRQSEQKRIERQNMSAEQVQYSLQQEIDRIKADYERQLEEREAEVAEVRFKSMVYDIAGQLGDVPSPIVKALTLPRPETEDALKELMSSLTEEVNNNRIYIGNRDKVASPPKSGDGKRRRSITPDEYEKMNEADRKAYISKATKEELETIQEQSLLK